VPVGLTLKEVERELICKTLEHTGGNRTKAAEVLGISRATLHNKLKEYGLG
jgi:DNA-binding protein Fis